MKIRALPAGLFILLLVLCATAQDRVQVAPQTNSQEKTEAVRIMDELQQDLANLEKSQQAYQQAAQQMATLSGGLSKKIDEVGKLSANVDPARPNPESAARLQSAIKQLMDMNQSFNMQYLGLQQQMQDESRRFTLLSNIMKTKHDTAKNSISNLR